MVYRMLARLGGRYGAWPIRPPSGDRLEALRELRLVAMNYRVPLEAEVGVTSDSPSRFSSLADVEKQWALSLRAFLASENVAPKIPRNEIEAISPEILIGAGLGIDFVLLLVAGFVAVFAALQTLYFGKTFGSPVDYLGMLMAGGLGASAQASIAGLAAIIGRLFQPRS